MDFLNFVRRMLERIEEVVVFLYMHLKYGSFLNLQDTLLRRCNFHIDRNSNVVRLYKCNIYNSKFIVNGNHNNIVVKDSNNIINGLSIKIYGQNNFLEIKDNACIYGLRIVIRGESCHIIIGQGFTENINCMLTCMGNKNYIEIGDDCMFSENIDIWNTDSHQIKNLKGDVINYNKPIIIGNHVWIGKNCTILKGVNIGDNSIVGMSSVVTKNVDSNSIYVGNPARKIKDNISWDRNYAIR